MYHLVEISVAFASEDIIWPVVSVSAMTWFIWYMYHSNLQFLNNVLIIIIKTKIHFHKAYVTLTDFGYPI